MKLVVEALGIRRHTTDAAFSDQIGMSKTLLEARAPLGEGTPGEVPGSLLPGLWAIQRVR